MSSALAHRLGRQKELPQRRTVAPERYDEIAGLIQKFIDEYSKEERMRMGENGHRYLLEHLTKEVSIEKYKEEILSC